MEVARPPPAIFTRRARLTRRTTTQGRLTGPVHRSCSPPAGETVLQRISRPAEPVRHRAQPFRHPGAFPTLFHRPEPRLNSRLPTVSHRSLNSVDGVTTRRNEMRFTSLSRLIGESFEHEAGSGG